jgi:site-specific DNA-methyltransferase (adenine-specific)
MAAIAHQTDRVTLWHGDALAVLAALPSGSVHAVFADPPYSSGGQFRGDRIASTKTKYVNSDSSSQDDLVDFSGDTRDSRAYGYWSALWLSEALRVTTPGGVCAVFTDWRQLPTTSDALQSGGWVWRGVVPWWKPAGRPVQGRWGNQCEYVVWGTNGPRSLDHLDGKALPGFYQANPPRERDHITQKPLEVMRALMQIARPGDIILDPFMGAGTTGVAAVIEGRNFVGVEMHEHHIETAVRRIRQALNEGVPDPGGQMSVFEMASGASTSDPEARQ